MQYESDHFVTFLGQSKRLRECTRPESALNRVYEFGLDARIFAMTFPTRFCTSSTVSGLRR